MIANEVALSPEALTDLRRRIAVLMAAWDKELEQRPARDTRRTAAFWAAREAREQAEATEGGAA